MNHRLVSLFQTSQKLRECLDPDTSQLLKTLNYVRASDCNKACTARLCACVQDVKRHDDPDLVVLATDECLFADEGFRLVLSADAAENICRDCSGHELMQTILLIQIGSCMCSQTASVHATAVAWKLNMLQPILSVSGFVRNVTAITERHHCLLQTRHDDGFSIVDAPGRLGRGPCLSFKLIVWCHCCRPYAEKYAESQDAFFEDYAKAHLKLSELGVQWDPEPIEFDA